MPSAGTEDADRARVILRYFVRHPQAADSVEGITRWRLMEETVARRLDETQRAIRWLVGRGYVREIALHAGGPPLYCLEEERASEARQFLDQGDELEPTPHNASSQDGASHDLRTQ